MNQFLSKSNVRCDKETFYKEPTAMKFNGILNSILDSGEQNINNLH